MDGVQGSNRAVVGRRRQGEGHSRWLLAVFMLLAAGSIRESIGPHRGGCGSGSRVKLRKE